MPQQDHANARAADTANRTRLRLFLAAVLLSSMCGSCTPRIHAQAVPAAQRDVQLSAFAGLTGSETGLNRNLAITAGLDVGLRVRLPFALYPSLEGRGTYPLDGGADAIRQRSTLAGIRLARFYGRVVPYADILVGRNQTNYDHGYVAAAGDRYYTQSVSTVISPGVGVEVALPYHLGVKLDAQLQHFDSPVSASGHLYAVPVTAGLVYRFAF